MVWYKVWPFGFWACYYKKTDEILKQRKINMEICEGQMSGYGKEYVMAYAREEAARRMVWC